MSLTPIDIEKYVEFAQCLFREYGKDIEKEAIKEVYHRYGGVTWYLQTIEYSVHNDRAREYVLDRADRGGNPTGHHSAEFYV